MSMRFSTASFLDQFFILIKNQTLISLSEQAATWLHNFVLISPHFILQPTNHVVYGAVHVGGTDCVGVCYGSLHSRHTSCQHLSCCCHFPLCHRDIRTVGAAWPAAARHDPFSYCGCVSRWTA